MQIKKKHNWLNVQCSRLGKAEANVEGVGNATGYATQRTRRLANKIKDIKCKRAAQENAVLVSRVF